MLTKATANIAQVEAVEILVAKILDYFIAHEGAAATVKELAEVTGWTDAKVRGAAALVFDLDNGWTRITPTDKYIEIREKNYRTVIGSRKVAAYQPARAFLALKLKQAENR